MIKRMFGSDLRSHSAQTRETELMYRVLAYNCHRTCVLSCVVLVMISMQPDVHPNPKGCGLSRLVFVNFYRIVIFFIIDMWSCSNAYYLLLL